MKFNEKHKEICDKKGDFLYIGTYESNESLISNPAIKRNPKVSFIRVKHSYCGSEIDISLQCFKSANRKHSCCCGGYENSFAHYIEVELNEPLDKYWDFEKNTVNPFHIHKNSRTMVWIKCDKTDYHDSTEKSCISFKKGRRCIYCSKGKIHPKDSFAQYHIENTNEKFLEKYWDFDKNTINPYDLAPGSDKYIWLKCQKKEYHGSYKIRAANFLHGNRCGLCKKDNSVHYLDSLKYKYPEIASMIEFDANKKNVDTTKITPHSSTKKYFFRCSKCGLTGTSAKAISSVVENGYSCEFCSDGISIPEKFVSNLLFKLNIKYIRQLSKKHFNWVKNYKYDFYIPSLNAIIEVHGLQHYRGENFNKNSGFSLVDVQNNDKNKKELAISNNIDKYIEIDCRYSTLEWLRENIEKTLTPYLSLKDVDWNDIWLNCQDSFVVKSWELWNNGITSTTKISSVLNIGTQTISKYLKRGNELGVCNYNPQEAMAKTQFTTENKKSVILLNNKKVFNSILEASRYVGLKKSSNISACCSGRRNFAGVYKDYPAVWMYLDDYKNSSNKDIESKISKSNNAYKQVVLLNNGQVFLNSKEAAKALNIKKSLYINSCCNGKQKTAGEYKNQPAIWMYLNDYKKAKKEDIDKKLEEGIISLTTRNHR